MFPSDISNILFIFQPTEIIIFLILYFVTFRCDNGHLDAYENGQDIRKSPPDSQLCGHNVPRPLTASNPRLLIVFNTHGSHSGRGFRAHYNFVTGMGVQKYCKHSFVIAIHILKVPHVYLCPIAVKLKSYLFC